MFAANNGQLDAVRQLLDAHAKVNVWNRNGQSALSYARLNGHAPIVQALKAAGALEARPAPAPRRRAPVRRRAR